MTVDQDNIFFKRLLDLVPPQVYFNEDEKIQIRNKGQNDDKDGHPSKKKKTKKHKCDDPVKKEPVTKLQATLNAIEDKIKAKKESKKKKEKQPNFQTNIQELQEKLKARIEELQAKRAGTLTEAEKQEEKSLRRKQKKLTVKAKKQKKAKAKSSDASGTPVVVSTSSASQKGSRGISSEKEGKMLFSKFEIPKSSHEKDTHKSKLVGKDYKRLLMKLEQRDAKIAKVKEKDPAAATKLEEKYVWQDVLSKARGEKVKDDPGLLKKALKRKEKIKSIHKKKWLDRQKTVNKQKKTQQEKRTRNIEARKDAKKEKKRKKLIKKGRLLPGL